MVAIDIRRLPSLQSSWDAPNALIMWHLLRRAACLASPACVVPIPFVIFALGGGFDGKSAGEGHLAREEKL